MHPQHHYHRLGALAASFAFALSTIAALAQVTPPPLSAAATDEPVSLSPFEVRTDRDTGWVAASTLIGNRTNTELANVPMSVDAITSEFMRDLGVYKLEDVAMFVANIDVVPEHETSAEEQRVNFRGMQLGGREVSQSSRNFFPWFTPTDTYNIDRVDFSKGSNSLMFGDSIPGGMANSYTKRPRFRNSGEFTFRYDSFESHRVQLDVNRKLSDGLAFRVNLVDREDKSYIDYAKSGLRAIHGGLTARPFRTTQLRFEGETGKFERSRASSILRIRPNSAPGRGFSTANRWYVTSDGEIIYVTTANTPAIDRSAPSGTLVSLMEGQSAVVQLMNSATAPSGQTVTFQGYDRKMNLRGTNDFLNRPYTTYTAYLEQQVGKLSFEFAFNRQDQQQERTDASFDSALSVDRRGRPYIESTINRRIFGDHVRIARAMASYPIEVGAWMKQFVVVAADAQRDELFNYRQNLANFAVVGSGPVNIVNHQVMFRAYVDDPRFPGDAFWSQFRPENLPRTATFQPGWYETTTADLPFIDVRSSRSYSASMAGRYWKDRVHTLLGVRHDAFKRKRITDLPLDSIGQYIFLGDTKHAPQAYEFDPQYDRSHTSYTAGAVYNITGSTNLYATYAESFRWQPYEQFTGAALGPVLGVTKEAGIKTTLLDRRLFLTLGVYRTDRDNTRYVWSPNDLSRNEMTDLFNPNDLAPGSAGYFLPAEGANDEFRTVPATERAEGFESTWQLQRMHGVQARLTFSRNKVATLRDFTHFRTLTEAAIERTQRALAPGGNAALAENQTYINDALRILAANEGVLMVTGSRSATYAANWTFDYQFPRETFLKGTRVAVYGNWRDNYNLSLIGGTMFRGGATHPIGAYVMHQRRIFGRATSFRVGFRNIVDLENSADMRITGVNELDATGNPTNYTWRYITPFSADFSMTVDF